MGRGPGHRREEIAYLNQRAIELNPDDSMVLAISGHLEAFARRDLGAAVGLFERAFEASRSGPHVWDLSAITEYYVGRPKEAMKRLERAHQIKPFDPNRYYFDTARVIAYSLAGGHEDPVPLGQRVLRNNANLTATYRPMIASLGHLGRVEEAHPLIATLNSLDPGFSIGHFRETYSPLLTRHGKPYIAGLRKAGVTEN
jgi:tetratricopeptide (TPR) repeat protein